MESLYKGQSIVLELNIIPRAFNNGHYAVFSIQRMYTKPSSVRVRAKGTNC
jgi:hypothetical protein